MPLPQLPPPACARRRRPRALTTRLALAALALAQLVQLVRAEAVEREAAGTWLFAAQNALGNLHPECASAMTVGSLKRYLNIDPSRPGAALYATRWRDLTVNGAACERSAGARTATIFDASGLGGGRRGPYAPYFLLGQDNSARRCGAWAQILPARYYFTRDLPRFRARFEDQGFLRAGQNASAVEAAVRGDVFMMSQQFTPDTNGSVASATVCFYKRVSPETAPASPEPTPPGPGNCR